MLSSQHTSPRKRLKTSRLWLRSTSNYPTAECFILCRTALEAVERGLLPHERLRPIIVKLTRSAHSYCGRASWTERHTGIVRHPDTHQRVKDTVYWERILVRIGPPSLFPRQAQYPLFKDMPEMEFRTYREAMVAVTAHEIAHTLGYSGRKSGEERCEYVALDALDYYRKHQAAIDAEIDAVLAAQRQREAAKIATMSPEAKDANKLAAAEAHLKRWKRKLTLATGKVRSYTSAVRRLSKGQRMSMQAIITELAQAATPPQ